MGRTKAFAIAAVMAALPPGLASAEPGPRDIAQALDAATGGDGVPVDAVEIGRCDRVAGQPGYVCTFSINECTAAGLSPRECDNPGVDQRAIFIGGDNGWYAIGLVDGDREPRLPLDPGSPLMNEVTEPWLLGSWNLENNCENDGGFLFDPDGVYHVAGGRGRWSLDGDVLSLTLTHGSPDGEGGTLAPLAAPETVPWTVMRMGINIGHVTFDDGSSATMIRC